MNVGSISIDLSGIPDRVYEQVYQQAMQRVAKGSQLLRNAELEVLRGARGGIKYRKPGGKTSYTASAPGEPPAVRTNTLRSSFRPIFGGSTEMSMGIESNVKYAWYLEKGTSKMAPRPFAEPIAEKAKPEIEALMNQPYQISI